MVRSDKCASQFVAFKMIVKCVKCEFKIEDPDCSTWFPDLTVGKTYSVLAVENDYFRLVGDEGRPYLYPAEAFVVVDDTPGRDWIREVDEEGEVSVGPAELLKVGLFEDYFDGNLEAQAIVDKFLR